MAVMRLILLALVASLVLRSVKSQGECLERWFEFCEGNDVSTSVCACVLYNDPSPGIFVDFGRDLMTCRQLNNDTACCNKTKDMLLAIYQLDTPVEAQCTEATVLNIGDGDGIDLSAPGTKTYPSSGVRQYIVPSFEFGCDGCVVGLRLWADQEDMLAQELNIHLWKKRTNLSANGNSTLYEERQVFTVSFDTNQDQDEITVPVSRGMNICFKTGEIFGFSQPAGSGYDIYFDIVSSTANTAYRIQRQVPACDNLQGFFELSDEAEVGVPLIELSIVPGTASLTLTVTPSTSVQVENTRVQMPTPTASVQSIPAVSGGTVVVNPSARPVPAKEEDDSLLYIIVIAAVAAVAGVAVVLIAAVLVAILVILALKRRRNRQKPSRMYAPNAIPLEVTADAVSYSTNGTTLSDIHSTMMDSLVNTRYESLTLARAAAGFPQHTPGEVLYDIPAELDQHPQAENMDFGSNDYQDIVDETPEGEHDNVYSGKYISMQPASETSRSGSRIGWEPEESDITTRRTLYDVPRELDLTNHPHYDIPKELSAARPPSSDHSPTTGAVHATYDVPRELSSSQPTLPHVYRVLEDPDEVSRDRSQSCESVSSCSIQETSDGVKHQYHILEEDMRWAESTQSSDWDTEGYSSSVASIPGIQRTPSHRQVDCGIYVPNTEERERLTGETGDTSKSEDPYAVWIQVKRTESTKRRVFFEDNKNFWKPASDPAKLYDQFAEKKFKEIFREEIQIVSHLGAGQFGSVNKALWKSPTHKQPLEVAVKMMKASLQKNTRVKFLQEAAILGQFFHPNVVQLYGVITVGDPAMIVLELMSNGDLTSYLRKNVRSLTLSDSGSPASLASTTLLSFSRQVASGMKYLARKKYVHRDLAARNILLSETMVCKIGDFGMSRGLDEDTNYYISTGGQVPIKWTAPEALLYKKYSSASDVYSYGMLLFEIWSLGLRPLCEVPFQQIASRVSKGYCQPPPPGTPRTIYQLMVQCWNPSYNDRPTFSDIVDYLGAPDESLLVWTSRDRAVSKGAAALGSPLDEGKDLFSDLQHSYNYGHMAV